MDLNVLSITTSGCSINLQVELMVISKLPIHIGTVVEEILLTVSAQFLFIESELLIAGKFMD